MILTGFPLPPSSNSLYASFRGRLIKSKAGRDYDNQVRVYGMTNRNLIESVKSDIRAMAAKGYHSLDVDCQFIFLRQRLIGAKGQLKRLDGANRLKCAHDQLAKLLGIDDCLFVSGSFSKQTCDEPKDEQVIITLSFAQMRHFKIA